MCAEITIAVTEHAIERYAQRVLRDKRLARTHADQIYSEIVARVLAGEVRKHNSDGDSLVAHRGVLFLMRNRFVITVMPKGAFAMKTQARRSAERSA